jgi:hypothetical protein
MRLHEHQGFAAQALEDPGEQRPVGCAGFDGRAAFLVPLAEGVSPGVFRAEGLTADFSQDDVGLDPQVYELRRGNPQDEVTVFDAYLVEREFHAAGGVACQLGPVQ